MYPDQSPTEDNIGAGTRRFGIARQQLKWSAIVSQWNFSKKRERQQDRMALEKRVAKIIVQDNHIKSRSCIKQKSQCIQKKIQNISHSMS